MEEYKVEYRRELYDLYREAERLVQQIKIREAIQSIDETLAVLRVLSNRITELGVELRRQRGILEEVSQNSKIVYSYTHRKKG